MGLRAFSLFFLLFAAALPSACASGPPPEDRRPEITVEKIAEHLNGQRVRVPAEEGASEPSVWRFFPNEPKEIQIVEKEMAGDRATIVVDVRTGTSPRSEQQGIHKRLSGRLRLYYELHTYLAVRKWEIERIENLTFAYEKEPEPGTGSAATGAVQKPLRRLKISGVNETGPSSSDTEQAAADLAVGLVGYGAAGRVFHAPVIQSTRGLRLAKVVERHASESSKRYPDVEVVRDAGELFADDAIGLVVVATPNASHFDLARDALLAGKHVVVDKPFTTTSADAETLAAIARERKLVVTAFHNRRWDGDFRTVRAIVASGLLGRLVAFESRFDRFRAAPRPGAWREAEVEGSGLLYDIAPHLVDQALALFGPPEEIAADVRIEREWARVDDAFTILLRYEGLRVTLGASLLARLPSPRFTLRGSLGGYTKMGLDPQEEALRAGQSPDDPNWGVEPEERWGEIDIETNGLRVAGRVETRPGDYRLFYENVRDAIAGREPIAVTPDDAIATIRVVELAIRASAERRALRYDSRG
jgi:predicted dehydrogenase